MALYSVLAVLAGVAAILLMNKTFDWDENEEDGIEHKSNKQLVLVSLLLSFYQTLLYL